MPMGRLALRPAAPVGFRRDAPKGMGNSQREQALARRAMRDLLAASWPVTDVARVLGVHRDTLYEWMRDQDAEAARVRRDCSALDEALLSET